MMRESAGIQTGTARLWRSGVREGVRTLKRAHQYPGRRQDCIQFDDGLSTSCCSEHAG